MEKIKKVQPKGPYYIAGWCIGGTIAFEIARQMEQQDDKIELMGIIDAPAPRMIQDKTDTEITPATELELIQGLLPAPGQPLEGEARHGEQKYEDGPGRIKNVTQLNRLWPEVIEYLQTIHFEVEKLRNIIPQSFAEAIPNFRQQGIREIIYYYNLIRSYDLARAKYIPAGKLKTPVHYFNATENEMENREIWENWNNY
ncbi:MAG: hypothetical protein GY757_39415, partial [bacterium]|nr:hypothetical protein [bacterium]